MSQQLPLKRRLDMQRASMKAERATWEPVWRDLHQWVLPDRCQFNLTDANRGTMGFQHGIIDSTPVLATRTLSAGLMSGMTSPARPWFRFTTEDPDLAEFLPVRQWLEHCEDRLRRAFRSSNLYQALPIAYGNCGVFGTEAIIMDEDFGAAPGADDVFRFYNLPIGSYYLSAGYRGLVDCLCREISMTVRQMVERWGERTVSPAVRQQWERCAYESPVTVIHCIAPNPEADPTRAHARYKRFLSVYYEASGGGDDGFLSRSGYDDFPALAPRWEVTGRNVYGFGAGRQILGDARALQAYERRIAEAVAKEVNPPLLAPSSLRGNEVQAIPGGITYYDESSGNGGQSGIRSLYEQRFNYSGAQQQAERCRQGIRRGLFEDLFLMLANSDRRQVTAEEIRAKQEEKILALGPVLERFNDELLDPLVERGFAILLRRRLLPPPPREIAGMKLGIEYISTLGQVQKMLGLGAIDRVLGVVGNLASVDPSVLDKIDRDKVVETYVDMLGATTGILRSDKEVQALRAGRAQAQAQARQQADLQGQAQAAQVLSKTDTRGDNGLTDLIRTQSGAQV